MRTSLLGTTGLRVSSLSLGSMMFGAWGNPDQDDCARMIHRALDAGINVIDTADIYSEGESEEIVGKAVAGRRDDVVLATKFHGAMGDDPNRQGNSRRWIVRALEESLQRLGTDHVDLYQVHRPDPRTDIDDTLAALSDLVHQGKVRYLGTSTFPAHAVVEAQWMSEKRGHERFRCEQPPYSIFVREIESAVLPTCERYGMGVITWGPLNRGMLTGRYRHGEELDQTGRAGRMPERFDPDNPGVASKLALVVELEHVAAEAGLSLTHLAIAFTLAHPAVSSTIIGPRTMEQLEQLLTGSDLALGDDVLDRIDEIVPPGANVHPGDAGWVSPAITESWRRRRWPIGSGERHRMDG